MKFRHTLRFSLLIVAFGMISATMSAQELSIQQQEQIPEKLLSTPRRAVHTFLHWQQEGHERFDLVVKTMTLAGNASREKRIELARNLRAVLDARGLVVNYDAIPNNPNYVDSLSGMHQYILFPGLPEIYLTKDENRWVFAASSIDEIPELYRETFSPFVVLVVDQLPNVLHQKWMGLKYWQYIAVFIWLLLGLLLRKLFEYLLNTYARRLINRTSTQWDDQLIGEIEKPVSFLFLMIFYLATYTNLMLTVTVNYYLSNTLEVAVSASFIWLFYNLINVLSAYLAQVTTKTESKLDDQLVPLLRKTLKIFVVVIGVIFVLQNHGINVTSLLAGLGLGGLAFALAARDSLANFFGSLTIFMDKPFQVGDYIKTSNVEGVVEEVGFRSTRVRTLYSSLISVPNSSLANSEIDNLGLREYRRLKMTLNLTYDTTPHQMEAFVEGIKAIIKGHPHIRQDFYEVSFHEYGSHSLDVLVYLFFKVPDWSQELQHRHNLLLE
ncbi:MAG: mechanosensitive ion channel, partial [Balneolaceae bacterium]|nr:mechanosensitive ion channel [Balneolaceae bacterium]